MDPAAPVAGFVAGVGVAGDDLEGCVVLRALVFSAVGVIGIFVAVAVVTVAPAVLVLAIVDSIKHNDALLGRCL